MVAIDEVQRLDPKDDLSYQQIIDHLKMQAEYSNKFRKIRRICDER